MRLAVVVALVGACSDPGNDVVGPFTGPHHLFVVDRIDVPRDATEAEAFAADLDGDGKPDNKFGYATAVLVATNDLSPNGPDMIASGALESFVQIQADSLADDDTVGVTYIGFYGATSGVAGGRLVGGSFVSNRTRETQHPGRGVALLPVFVNADPVSLPVEGLEIELTPDGAGGYDAVVRGVMDERTAREKAHFALVQMIENEPERHLVFHRGIDEDRDGVISFAEVEASVIGLLVAADVEHAGIPGVSIAFGMHLTPCTAGADCIAAQPQNPCRDRTRSPGESDIDCGGACPRCADRAGCFGPEDCQSNACDNGVCRGATCSDGVLDGLESDIDCGGTCPLCAVGDSCAADRDCAGNNCNNGPATVGTCR